MTYPSKAAEGSVEWPVNTRLPLRLDPSEPAPELRFESRDPGESPLRPARFSTILPFYFFLFFFYLVSFFCALSLISFPLFIFNFCVFFLRFLPPPPPPQFPVFYGTIRMEEGTKFQTSSMFFCSSAFIFMGVAPVGGGIVSIRSIASSSSGFRLAFIE